MDGGGPSAADHAAAAAACRQLKFKNGSAVQPVELYTMKAMTGVGSVALQQVTCNQGASGLRSCSFEVAPLIMPDPAAPVNPAKLPPHMCSGMGFGHRRQLQCSPMLPRLPLFVQCSKK